MSVDIMHWGQTDDGTDFSLFTLENDVLKVQITNLGAALVTLEAPDRNGQRANVNLRHAAAETYIQNPSSFGATCGRYANRIGKGQFELDGKQYQLALNNGPNHLHGGVKGFNHYIWSAEPQADFITFRMVSPNGDEGYPGELNVAVTYTLKGNELILNYKATTDAPTVLNLTNHAYWNLGGVNSGTVYDHVLQLACDKYLEADANVLVTGKISDVAGTPFDFRKPETIGARINQVDIGGYDHCYAINDWDGSLRTIAKAVHPESGRVMEVATTEPGVQLYTANHFSGNAGSAGSPKHGAFCLECQHYPDSPNHSEFPSTVLRPGEEYTQKTIHRFLVD
ncbi:MAG: aldose epimerase family protein [Planctomycetaceae bacterium]